MKQWNDLYIDKHRKILDVIAKEVERLPGFEEFDLRLREPEPSYDSDYIMT
jgi:hypothetical protein